MRFFDKPLISIIDLYNTVAASSSVNKSNLYGSSSGTRYPWLSNFSGTGAVDLFDGISKAKKWPENWVYLSLKQYNHG